MEPVSKILRDHIQTAQNTQNRSDLSEDEWFLPDGSICSRCNLIITDYPGVQRVLRAQRKSGIGAICRCDRDQDPDAIIRAQLLRFANLPHPHKPRLFGNFESVAGSGDAIHSSKEFANGNCTFHMLVLTGSVGCGKSHLLEAIGRRLLERGRVVKYEHTPEMLDKIRDSYKDASDIWTPYETAETLILDDLGVERSTPWVVERLSVIIDKRYRMGQRTAIATNLTKKEVEDRDNDDYGNQTTDGWARIASRMYDQGSGDVNFITMDCEDYRSRR